MEAFHARDPYVPNEQIRNNLPEPFVRFPNLVSPPEMILMSRIAQSREELQARQAALASEVPGHGTQQGNLM
jgi:hypothetical protein